MLEWDETKRLKTMAKHGVDFHDMARFDWETALTWRDVRLDYGEPRFVSIGPIDERLYCCAWTPRDEAIRIVMLRKANEREKRRHKRSQQDVSGRE